MVGPSLIHSTRWSIEPSLPLLFNPPPALGGRTALGLRPLHIHSANLEQNLLFFPFALSLSPSLPGSRADPSSRPESRL